MSANDQTAAAPDEPAGGPADNPAGGPGDNPAGGPADGGADNPAGGPADGGADNPANDPIDEAAEAEQLARIEANLAEIVTHVDSWLHSRFLDQEEAAAMNLEDVAGLILWLQQWQAHFDSLGRRAARLEEAGRPAMATRLAQIHEQIGVSIESFTTMMAGLLGGARG